MPRRIYGLIGSRVGIRNIEMEDAAAVAEIMRDFDEPRGVIRTDSEAVDYGYNKTRTGYVRNQNAFAEYGGDVAIWPCKPTQRWKNTSVVFEPNTGLVIGYLEYFVDGHTVRASITAMHPDYRGQHIYGEVQTITSLFFFTEQEGERTVYWVSDTYPFIDFIERADTPPEFTGNTKDGDDMDVTVWREVEMLGSRWLAWYAANPDKHVNYIYIPRMEVMGRARERA